MEKTIACPGCGQMCKTIPNARTHGMAKHGWTTAVAEAKIPSLPPAISVPTYPQLAPNLNLSDPEISHQEVPSMSDCPTCKLNEYRAAQAEKQLEQRETQWRDERAALMTQVGAAQKDAADVKAKPLDDAPKDLPSLRDVLTHCTSGNCPEHRRELSEFLETQEAYWQKNLTPDQAKDIARQHKLWPPPSINLSGFSPGSTKERS